MRTLLVLLALVAPVAAAGPVSNGCHADAVCFFEADYGSCEDGYRHQSTSAGVVGHADVVGYRNCYGTGGEGGAYVSTAVGQAGYGEVWYSDPENGDFHGCWVYAPAFYNAMPCLSASPDWGHLLP